MALFRLLLVQRSTSHNDLHALFGFSHGCHTQSTNPFQTEGELATKSSKRLKVLNAWTVMTLASDVWKFGRENLCQEWWQCSSFSLYSTWCVVHAWSFLAHPFSPFQLDSLLLLSSPFVPLVPSSLLLSPCGLWSVCSTPEKVPLIPTQPLRLSEGLDRFVVRLLIGIISMNHNS